MMNKLIYISIIILSFQITSSAQADLDVDKNGFIEKTLTIGENTFSSNSELKLNDYDNDGSCLMLMENGTRRGIMGIDATQNGITGTLTAHDLQFWTNLSARLHIESTGLVGLNTTSPGAAFHISEPGVANVPINVAVVESATSNKPILLFSEDGLEPNKTMGILYDGSSTFGNEKLQVINDSSTPIVTWLDTGGMGIGTTSALHELDVAGNVAISTTPGSFILDNGTNDSELTFDGSALVLKSSAGSSKILADRRIILQSLANDIVLDAKDDIRFQIDGTTQMVCKQSGNWGINKFLPTARFHVKQNTTNLPAILIENDQDADTWDWEILTTFLGLSYNNVLKGEYSTTGAYTNTSDRRLKEEIELINDGVLESILKLNPSSYFYNSDLNSENRTIGFIAQELQEYFPSLVKRDGENESDYLGVNYAGISVIAVKAIQEQNQEINSLKKEVEGQKVDEKEVEQVADTLADIEKRIAALK